MADQITITSILENTVTFSDSTIIDVTAERLEYRHYAVLREYIENRADCDELADRWIDFDNDVEMLVPGDLENAGFDSDDAFDVLDSLDPGDGEFTWHGNGGEWRFINGDDLLNIAYGEIIDADEYVLGSFAPWFIADNTRLDFDVVEAMQKGELFAELGRLIQSENRETLESFVDAYLTTDGNGHHFGTYDGNEYEFEFNGDTWHAFRTN